MWWDAGINDKDRGKIFTYTITPVRGTWLTDLKPVTAAAATIKARLPNVEEDGISNPGSTAPSSVRRPFRANSPDPKKEVDDAMKWLANGLQIRLPKNPCQSQRDRRSDLSPDRQ